MTFIIRIRQNFFIDWMIKLFYFWLYEFLQNYLKFLFIAIRRIRIKTDFKPLILTKLLKSFNFIINLLILFIGLIILFILIFLIWLSPVFFGVNLFIIN